MLKFNVKPVKAQTPVPPPVSVPPPVIVAPAALVIHTDPPIASAPAAQAGVRLVGRVYSQLQLEELVAECTAMIIGDRDQVTRILLKYGWKHIKTRGSYLFEPPAGGRPKDYPMAKLFLTRELAEPFRALMNSRISKEPLSL